MAGVEEILTSGVRFRNVIIITEARNRQKLPVLMFRPKRLRNYLWASGLRHLVLSQSRANR